MGVLGVYIEKEVDGVFCTRSRKWVGVLGCLACQQAVITV